MVLAAGSSSPMEKRETFCLGAGAAALDTSVGAAAAAAVETLFWDTATPGDGLGAARGPSFFLFLAGAFFLATERGLNMSGLPTNFTSSSGFWPSGIDGPARALELGAGRFSPDDEAVPSPPKFDVSSSSLPPLTNAGSAPVRKCTPGAGAVPRLLSAAADAMAAVFLGGGKKEPKLLNLLPPAVFTRFAGGCSSSALGSGAAAAGERLTRIFPAPDERLSSFWNGFFDAGAVDDGAALGVGFCGTDSVSDSESE